LFWVVGWVVAIDGSSERRRRKINKYVQMKDIVFLLRISIANNV
jgi:hypothetical protein